MTWHEQDESVATTISRPTLIPPRSGTAFELKRGQCLRVIDPEGEQVADLVAFNLRDLRESISSGRSLDYNSKLHLSTGDLIYSNRGNAMLEIKEDTVGRHDFLLAPCSAVMFKLLYGHKDPHRGCFGNLCAALAPYDISPDEIPTAFNVFMNVAIDPKTSKIEVLPPLSRADSFTVFEAKMDLLIGLTACSAPLSNNGRFKPIEYAIE